MAQRLVAVRHGNKLFSSYVEAHHSSWLALAF